MGARGRSLAAALLVTGLLVTVSPATGAGAAAPSAQPRAKAPRCTIVGTPRADRLVGTPRRDVICGRGGNDVIIGAGGGDLLIGGRGADTIEGRAGRDRLVGGAGDDVLDGGAAADDLNGGAGANVCTLDASDEANRCVYDRSPAKAVALTVSTSAVDVTAADAQVVYRVHVTDDTGVASVVVQPGRGTPWFPQGWGTLRSGTKRDGWYEVTLTFPRWSMPGTFSPQVVMFDRLDRRSSRDFDGQQVTVRNDEPDLELPTAELLAPTATQTFDTRTSAKVVTVQVHVTDAMSGVDANQASLTMFSPDGQRGVGGGLKLASGTIRDGVWTGKLPIPKQSIGGDWNLAVNLSDLASRGSQRLVSWVSLADSAREARPGQELKVWPAGTGTVRVVGRARTDVTPPTVSSAEVSPATVDTLAGPATVLVTVHAADASRVAGVHLELRPLDEGDGAPQPLFVNATITDGSLQDGIWNGSITLPQGLPPGVYYLHVTVWDNESNMAGYWSQQYPDPPAGHVLPGSTIVTVLEH